MNKSLKNQRGYGFIIGDFSPLLR